jgi:hypothetical protein
MNMSITKLDLPLSIFLASGKSRDMIFAGVGKRARLPNDSSPRFRAKENTG